MKPILYKELKYYVFIDSDKDKYTVKISKDNVMFLKNNKINVTLSMSIKDLENCIAYSTILGIEYQPGMFRIVENIEDAYETPYVKKDTDVIRDIIIKDLDDNMIAEIEANLTQEKVLIVNYENCKISITEK